MKQMRSDVLANRVSAKALDALQEIRRLTESGATNDSIQQFIKHLDDETLTEVMQVFDEVKFRRENR